MTNGQLFEPPRRWHDGMYLTVDGIQFRVRPGNKEPGDELAADLVLEHLDSSQRWRPTKIALPLVMVDFLAENETGLHPVADGKLGGKKVLEACRSAIQRGWRSASDWIDKEKKAAREK